MKIAAQVLFYILTVALLAAAFSPRLRGRVLAVRGVAALERRLRAVKGSYALAVVLCMAAGLFARCYRFGELPLGLNQDGAMGGVEAYCLMMDGTDQYGTSWPVYFEAWGYAQMSTLYSWLVIPAYCLLGVNRFALRLPMLLASTVSLLVIWDFARRVGGKGFGLAALFVAAINPWQITQSRWAIDCNLMPHILLLAVYLLYLGRQSRPALYGSMAVFALTLYAYGLALFTTPLFLVAAAVFYAARKRVRPLDLFICVAVFLAVAWPYLATMAINSLGLESVQLGKMTMPLFDKTIRTRDMAIFQDRAYTSLIWNFYEFLATFLFDRGYAVDWIDWAHTMYRFAPPIVVCGLYWMWRNRREMAFAGSECPERDGLMLILLWMGAATVNGMMVGGVVNRCNAVFYPLMLLCAYGLCQMGRRLRVAAAAAAAMLGVAFVCFCGVYFTDEAYQTHVGTLFHYGAQEALDSVRDSDAERIYVTNMGSAVGEKLMRAQVMFAHEIDYSQVSGQKELTDSAGRATGRTFGERYAFTGLESFVPDPQEDAVYIVRQSECGAFDETQFTIESYGVFAVVTPRSAGR